jgi:hypothetical protein
MITHGFFRFLTLVCLLLISIILLWPSAGLTETKATPGPLETLLKQTGLDYVKGEEGQFKIYVKFDGAIYMLLAYETELEFGETKLKQVVLYSEVMPVPKKLPDAEGYFTRVAELNDKYKIGKLGLSENTLWYNSAFWSDIATSKMLLAEVYIGVFVCIDAKKTLMPLAGIKAP